MNLISEINAFNANFQAELTRITIFWAAIELALFIVGMWVLYLVIKAAVRDGIDESELTRLASKRAIRSQPQTTDLPAMRAD